ncbi:MAG: SAM-dependent methyltransferase, partial [Actinobacteria bacterium]|nr:SAM-dependent methyltransferase [Actinomycetota bacterium]
MTTTVTEIVDEAAVGEFALRFLTDLGAAHHAVTVAIGDRLGLYRAMAATGPASEREIAATAGCDERYTREWLNAQAASGYCEYDPETGRYHLTPAQRVCLADEASPTFLTAGVFLAASLFKDEERLAEAI